MHFLIIFSIFGLGAIWIGYPLSVAVFAALRPSPLRPTGEGGERVSVILATHHAAEVVRPRIANLLQTSFDSDRIEVIVGLDVARGHSWVSELLGAIDERVRIVSGDPPGGKAATLNAAVRAAQHEILVFADTAQSFDRNAIDELVRALRDPALGAVSGILDLSSQNGPRSIAHTYWSYERALRKAEARFGSTVGVTGAIYAMRRDLWQPLPAGLILDDVYVPMRLALDGWRIGFTDRARALDHRQFTPAQEHRRKIRTLTGVFQLCAWLPAVLVPRRNPLWLQFVCHKLLRFTTPYLLALCAAGVVWQLSDVVASQFRARQLIWMAAGLIGVLSIRPIRHRLASQLAWAFALQTAVVVATINGIRGRWDVWQQ